MGPNEDQEVQQWIIDHLGFALRVGHTILLRPIEAWNISHWPLAKNTAHVAGLGHWADDRIHAAKEDGVTVGDDVLDRAFLVNVDNDNFITVAWLHSAMWTADTACSARNRWGCIR